MSDSVSVIVPALDDVELLARNLPAIGDEIAARDGLDELVVVDDTGAGVLTGWVSERFPHATLVTRQENGGYGTALLDGVRAAQNELVFATNPDVRVRPGFLAPLVAAMEDPGVFAASPRVLLGGLDDEIESHNALAIEDGRLCVLARSTKGVPVGPRPVPFAVGGAMMMRRSEFCDSGGFDPLFEPFYWEDVDLCIAAWRAGRTVVEVPESVVEHHHRGTIGPNVPDDVVQAAIEKNRLLLQWKYLKTKGEARDHLSALWRDALDAGMGGRRDELVWIALALQQLPAVSEIRGALGAGKRTFEEVLRVSDPLP